MQFSQPVPLYVENFLGFPVGGAVPAGYYDRGKGQWIASDNGKIIQVIGIVEGLAELDTDGDGAPDDAATALGISDNERQQLAALYRPGQSLAPIPHFTPWDCNWPYRLPERPAPQLPEPQDTKQVDDPDCQGGVGNDRVPESNPGETLDIAGTALRLHYRSNRVPGRRDAYTVKVPLSTAHVSPSLKRIELVIQIATISRRRVSPLHLISTRRTPGTVWMHTDAPYKEPTSRLSRLVMSMTAFMGNRPRAHRASAPRPSQ